MLFSFPVIWLNLPLQDLLKALLVPVLCYKLFEQSCQLVVCNVKFNVEAANLGETVFFVSSQKEHRS